MALGPLMLDLEGVSLTDEERDLLLQPSVGGVILFTRNYQSCDQLKALTAQMRALRPELIIAVDHEGGRVQRFREGFTRVPPMRKLGELYQLEPAQAELAAKHIGWLIAAELLVHGVDLSFAPVLDLDREISEVIGDRAFSNNPDTIIALAGALIEGFHAAGMSATGKHFPGHGGVAADSHLAIPVDERPYPEIAASDLQPFKALAGILDAVMPAHVIYAAVDPQPAGFSRHWIQRVLRQQLGFEGVVFSDDLSMEGATVAGCFAERAEAALTAGCDMVLVCNNRSGALEVLEYMKRNNRPVSHRLQGLKRATQLTDVCLEEDPAWQAAIEAIQRITA